MRIIGGKFSGRRIIAPKGLGARPTADRTREALFNILAAREDAGLNGARVLDLFAGSGALGLEAMSRGAAFCLFVETDAGARAAIRENIEALGLGGGARLYRRSASGLGRRPGSLGAPFEIAFLDPPYARGLAPEALACLAAGDWLADGALLIVDQGADEPPAAAPGFAELDRRRYGAAQIGIYRRDNTAG